MSRCAKASSPLSKEITLPALISAFDSLKAFIIYSVGSSETLKQIDIKVRLNYNLPRMSDSGVEIRPSEVRGLEIPVNNEVKTSIFRLRLLSPVRMAKIGNFLKERSKLAEALTIDNVDHGMGANRFSREMDYNATEGNIVRQAIEGLTNDSLLTRKDWGNVTLALGVVVNPQRRTQIYADLNHFVQQTKNRKKQEAITRILVEFEKVDPGIKERASDESYFSRGMVALQIAAINDTLSRLFNHCS